MFNITFYSKYNLYTKTFYKKGIPNIKTFNKNPYRTIL